MEPIPAQWSIPWQKWHHGAKNSCLSKIVSELEGVAPTCKGLREFWYLTALTFQIYTYGCACPDRLLNNSNMRHVTLLNRSQLCCYFRPLEQTMQLTNIAGFCAICTNLSLRPNIWDCGFFYYNPSEPILTSAKSLYLLRHP